jgi:hypothetical protein
MDWRWKTDDTAHRAWRFVPRPPRASALRTEQPARLVTGPGETVAVEIRTGAGDFRLLVRSFNDFEATIRVRLSS